MVWFGLAWVDVVLAIFFVDTKTKQKTAQSRTTEVDQPSMLCDSRLHSRPSHLERLVPENTRTHKSKSTTVVVYAARAMEIAPVHSSGSHEGACSGCSKEAPKTECRSRRLLVCEGAQPCDSSAQRNSTTGTDYVHALVSTSRHCLWEDYGTEPRVRLMNWVLRREGFS